MLFAATFHCLSVRFPEFLRSSCKRQAHKADERTLKHNTLIYRSMMKREKRKYMILLFFSTIVVLYSTVSAFV